MGQKEINHLARRGGMGRRVGRTVQMTGEEGGRRRRAVELPARRVSCALRPCKDDRRGGRPAPCGLARATGRIAGDERNRRGGGGTVADGGSGGGASCEAAKREDSTRESPTPNPHPTRV